MTPYYADDHATLYHGDCLAIDAWTDADVLITDPPYGRSWKSGRGGMRNSHGTGRGWRGSGGIAGDENTYVRDSALTAWGGRPAIVFGDLLVPPPPGARQALVYAKATDSGVKGAHAGFRRDVEGIYLCGKWPVGVGGRTSVLTSKSWTAGMTSPAYLYRHPHAKPLDLLTRLIELTPEGSVIADPFTGSGSTLVAAKLAGRHAIAVELEERHCEMAARRLSQDVLNFGDAS